MNAKDLVKSIVANPSAHFVDRNKKMDDTIDVMCKNLDARQRNKIAARALSDSEVNRGYGEGRKMGD